MKNPMAPYIPPTIVLFAAVAAVALRVAARRPRPIGVLGIEPAHDSTGCEMARPPSPPGRPASAFEPVQQIFHELHADGRNTLCVVCDSRYRSA
jgi:hypothetical protein